MNQLTSLEIRHKIKLLSEQGLSSPLIAEQLGVSVWTVRKWRQFFKKELGLPSYWSPI